MKCFPTVANGRRRAHCALRGVSSRLQPVLLKKDLEEFSRLLREEEVKKLQEERARRLKRSATVRYISWAQDRFKPDRSKESGRLHLAQTQDIPSMEHRLLEVEGVVVQMVEYLRGEECHSKVG